MTTNNLDLSGLIKFLGRDDWAFHFEEVMANIWPVMELDHEGIVEAIGDHWGMTLWTAHSTISSCRLSTDRPTFVDAYLKRRGWKESARTKAYVKALSCSVISLYEVSGIVPGTSFLAHDLLRDGEPLRSAKPPRRRRCGRRRRQDIS